uniref:CNNM transmembrane domain-containing protein n=1 Tax=Setaria digitata TaxID=48799 RepID=A0A915PGK3_9BILA
MRTIDDDYFNFVTRLARNRERQRVIVFGEHLSDVSRFWFSVDLTCSPDKKSHSAYVKVRIEKRIDDRILQCVVDTLGSNITRPMQLCVEPSQLMPQLSMENFEFTQIILEETVTHLFPVYIELMVIGICALFSATFSGLTTGLMALSTDDLKLIAEGSEDKKEREYASNILPLRTHGNFLLCSIVLGNTICNTVITLLISDMCESIDKYSVNVILSLVIPTAVITLLGEIVPQAICARHALSIGSRTRYLTIFFMVLSAPISYPFSLALDCLLGKEGRDVYDRKTLRVLITMQRDLTKEKLSNQMDGEATDLVLAAFDLPEKIVKSVMTPIEKMFMISDQSVIDKTLLKAIAAKGRTRIPIYSGNDRNTITAILNMKDLLPFCKTNFLKVGTVVQLWQRSSQFRFIIGSMPVLQLLIEMRTGIHIAMVVTYDDQKRDYIVQGLVTLEDLVEEVLFCNFVWN